MNIALLKQIEQWHEDGGHEEIVDAVRALPEAERDYNLTCMLARALNNLSRYEEALWILESVREEGQDDALWHFRVAYSLFYLDREGESIPYFQRAIKLGDDHPSTYQMLLWAKKAVEKHQDLKTEAGQTHDEDRAALAPQAIVTIELNMRLQLKARAERFEDCLDLLLRSKGLGYVNGGDSRRSPEGETEACSIELKLTDDSAETREIVLTTAHKLDAAKGSMLRYRSLTQGDEKEYPIGKLEGFALYISRSDLPEEVYKNHSINEVVDALHDVLSNNGTLVFSYWNGPKEIALYFYGEGGVEAMLEKAKPFLDAHPLCQDCRLVRLT